MTRLKASRCAAAGVSALALVAGVTLAQQRPMGPGFHVVNLPTATQAAGRLETKVLLETPHLKLTSVVIPKGGVLATHSVPNQVSLQALSGSGEVHMDGTTERIDTGRLIVLAPDVQHEVRASADATLVLLIHHVLPGPGSGPHGGQRGPR